MDKSNLVFSVLTIVFYSTFAQNTCTNALAIASGTHTVADVNSGQVPNPDCAENFGQLRTGGRWFSYTASVDGVAKVSSDLAINANTDTRLHIYSGNCSTLMCIAGNDDKDPFGNIRTSEVIWPVSSGSTYYIAWDNQYSSNGFDFQLSETMVSCPDGALPYTGDFDDLNAFIACYTVEDGDGNGSDWKLQFVDFDGDGNDEDYTTTGTNSNIAKDDWLFSPSLTLVNSSVYTIDFKYNGGNGTFPANENLEVLLVDAPIASANVLTSLYTETGIARTGDFSQAEALATVQSIEYTSTISGTYYLAFHATSPENSGSLLLFDFSVTDNTLTTPDVLRDTFEYTYNKNSDVLTLGIPSLELGELKLYSLLGREVLTRYLTSSEERINVSRVPDGIYIVTIVAHGSTKNFKFLKH